MNDLNIAAADLAVQMVHVEYEPGWAGRLRWSDAAAGIMPRSISNGLAPRHAISPPHSKASDASKRLLPAENGDGAPPAIPAVRPPTHDDGLASPPRPSRSPTNVLASAAIAVALVSVGAWHFAATPAGCWLTLSTPDPSVAQIAANVVARRIVRVESNGDDNARNPRSTATGAGQFLDGTWLDMIRAYRPDLQGRAEAEILDLRYDPAVSREMVARFAEQNAAMLGRRCLPVTPGTLYLSHFAGSAGAAAVLTAPETADAAAIMAEADSTGQTTREMIVNANPFLADFTVADLIRWAHRKMGGVDHGA